MNWPNRMNELRGLRRRAQALRASCEALEGAICEHERLLREECEGAADGACPACGAEVDEETGRALPPAGHLPEGVEA